MQAEVGCHATATLSLSCLGREVVSRESFLVRD